MENNETTNQKELLTIEELAIQDERELKELKDRVSQKNEMLYSLKEDGLKSISSLFLGLYILIGVAAIIFGISCLSGDSEMHTTLGIGLIVAGFLFLLGGVLVKMILNLFIEMAFYQRLTYFILKDEHVKKEA